MLSNSLNKRRLDDLGDELAGGERKVSLVSSLPVVSRSNGSGRANNDTTILETTLAPKPNP